jgi:hypothetical protein
MPRRWLRTTLMLQVFVLLTTFLSPAYAAGAVADPSHHGGEIHAPHEAVTAGHDHHPAHGHGHGHDGATDDGSDPHQLIGHVLAHLSPVATAESSVHFPPLRDDHCLPTIAAPHGRDLPRGLFRPPRFA